MTAARLDALLAQAFSAAELKQLAGHYDSQLLTEVSFDKPTKDIAFDLVQVLTRQNRLDQPFIDLLIQARPRWADHFQAAFTPYRLQPQPRIDARAVLAAYRTRMLERYGRISMIGVQVDDFEFGMNDVYVPLRFVEAAPEMKLRGKRHPLSEPGQSISVDHIFRTVEPPTIPTIMGEAGSGKTTAMLKLLHTVLTQHPDVSARAGLHATVRLIAVRPASRRTHAAPKQRAVSSCRPRGPPRTQAAIWRRAPPRRSYR